MPTLSLANTDEDFKPSTLSQRIKALESAGITDKFIKKRIPSYASEAAEIGGKLSHTLTSRNFEISNQTKIYQNPTSKIDQQNINTIITSIYSNENNAKIYRSNSVNSIEQTSDNDTINENSDNIIREDRIKSPVNIHHIINELNDAKSRLRRVPEPVSSLAANRLGHVLGTSNINTIEQKKQEKIPSPNLETSFSRATSKLLAESLKKNASNLTSNNDSNSSLNQIPISIPLNDPPTQPNYSRSSTPNGIASLVGIFHDINRHSSDKKAEKSQSLMNIYDSTNHQRNSDINLSIRSDHSYNKYINTSPRPYQNPIGSISSLKNIANDILGHHKVTEQAEDNISIRSMRSSMSSQHLNHQPIIVQSSSNRSSFETKNTSGKPYVSQYTARASNLAIKNSNQMTSSANDLLNTTPLKAPSYEQLDSNGFNKNRPLSGYLTKKSESTSLYDEYLNSNKLYGSINKRSSSVSSSNTITGIPNNHNHQYTNNSNQNIINNSRSHLLIFNSEYTRAMNQNFHTDHFSCHNCDKSLTGCRYILKEEQPHCISCYELLFANSCEECKSKIGTDSKDLSYKEKHWHEKCFFCHVCKLPLVDKPFGSKNDSLYCGECYNQAFASRCDKCAQIFKPGMKKMEYKGQQFHENCFLCSTCNISIGAKSFIPKDNKIFCVPCYEHNFATKCTKCCKVISQGGVTYKNMPFHRECFTCTNCQSSLAGQRFTSRDDHPYCSECFGKLFAKKCYSCIKPITGIGGTKYISFEDRHWHNECFDCNQCHTSLVGRGFLTDAMDILCPDCGRN